jgi:hypothetical protein
LPESMAAFTARLNASGVYEIHGYV